MISANLDLSSDGLNQFGPTSTDIDGKLCCWQRKYFQYPINKLIILLVSFLKGEKILIDGGTGTEVERRGVPQLKNAWNAGGALTHPEIIKGIHSDFIKEGAKIIIRILLQSI